MFTLAFLAIVVCLASAGPVYYSCIKQNNNYVLVSGKSPNAIAYGFYEDDTINTTGWATLSITTSPSYDDAVQAYAAGFLEGSLTYTSIAQSFTSMLYAEWPTLKAPPPKVTAWIQQNINWVQCALTIRYSNLI